MQKTVAIINYRFDGKNVLIHWKDCSYFRDHTIIMLRYCGNSPNKNSVKISLDVFRERARQKLLVIFSNNGMTGDICKSVYDHQRELTKSNKNMCFGCCASSCVYHGDQLIMTTHIPDGVLKFVVVYPKHNMNAPNINFDLRGLFHLRNLYHCFVDRITPITNVRGVVSGDVYDINNNDGSIVKYDKFIFKLSYGCTNKVIKNFNEVVID